jgi:hypothetical protein
MHLQSALLRTTFAAVALAAAQASMATTTTLTLLPAAAANVNGDTSTSAPGFPNSSWAAAGTAKSELYVQASSLFSSPVHVRDIASISYWTNKAGGAGDPDWTLLLYTAKLNDGNDSGSFYRSRLNSEPYFTQSAAIPANTWHEWSTGNAADSLRFYDQPRGGNFGTYNDPLLSDLKAGPVTWSNSTVWNYSEETISLFSLQTGSSWAAGFVGLVDGMTITLTNGDVGIVNLEAAATAVPEPASVALVGLALLAAGAARRRRA